MSTAPRVETKAFLQAAKAAATSTASCIENRIPPPIPPFLLAQNLSKRIAPTDNMRPKSDDANWHHQWLKGFNISTCCNPNDAYRIYLVSAISNQNVC